MKETSKISTDRKISALVSWVVHGGPRGGFNGVQLKMKIIGVQLN